MKLLNFLPFEKYILTTKLHYDEIFKLLDDNIEPKKNIQFFAFNRDSDKPYQGEISGNSFTMSRIIKYNNSFLPVVKGKISSIVGETQIRIVMRPQMFFLIFGSLWMAIVGLFCAGFLLGGLLNLKQIVEHGFSPAFLMPFGMFIFGYLLISISFKKESKKSQQFLATLLDAE